MRGKLASIAVMAAAATLLMVRHSAGGQQKNAVRARAPFVGTWRLVSAQETLGDGTVRPYKDLGPNGQGYLIYSADGHMCAALMNPDRPRWSDSPTDAQRLASLVGFVGYCGRFEVDPDRHVMFHFPDVAWKPNYVGTRQVRPYTFAGDHLVYSDKASRDGAPEVVAWRIEWQRVNQEP